MPVRADTIKPSRSWVDEDPKIRRQAIGEQGEPDHQNSPPAYWVGEEEDSKLG